MNFKLLAAAAATSLCVATTSNAASYVYDFVDEIDHGSLSEAAFDTFNTSPTYSGPNLAITATREGFINGDSQGTNEALVYLDYNDAGLGVCRSIKSGESINTIENQDGRRNDNRCEDGGDDSIQTNDKYSEFHTVLETLIFTATEAVFVDAIWVNANHDNGLEGDEEFLLDGVLTKVGASVGGGNYLLAVNRLLNIGDFFTVSVPVGTENSYVSALAVSEVPIPAPAFLLLAGLGGLAAMKRRKAA